MGKNNATQTIFVVEGPHGRGSDNMNELMCPGGAKIVL